MPCFSVLNQKFRVFAAPSSETKEVLLNFSENPACSLFTFAFLFNYDLLTVYWLKVFGANKLLKKVPLVHTIVLFTFLCEPHQIPQLCKLPSWKTAELSSSLVINELPPSKWAVPLICTLFWKNTLCKQRTDVCFMDMKDVLRCRHTCHHFYQEVLQMVFSIRQHLYAQLCARHIQDSVCKISFLAQRSCWQTKLSLIPNQLRWRSSFPRLPCLLKVSLCLIWIKTTLFSSSTQFWLKDPGVFRPTEPMWGIRSV